VSIQQQMQQMPGAIDRKTELEDAGLMDIFLAIVDAPEVPDLSNLAGRPLDDVLPPLVALALDQDGPALTLRVRVRERESTASIDVTLVGA
jgi:hypothetical protein